VNRRTRLAFSSAALFSALALSSIGLGSIGLGALDLGATPALASGVHTDDSDSASPTTDPSAESSEDAPDPREGLEGVDDLTPITGGAHASVSPTVKAGRYIDTAPEWKDGEEDINGVRGYAYHRTMKGSTIAFGGTVLGDDVSAKDRLNLWLYVQDPKDSKKFIVCGVARRSSDDKPKSIPLATFGGWSSSRDVCVDAETVYVVLLNSSDGEWGATVHQLLATGTPYELDVWEQPAVTNADKLNRPYDYDDWVLADASDPTVQAEPGVSMSTATPLPDGETAAVDLPLGKISWFYVPVDLGQRLQVLAETADGASVAGAAMEVRLVSPVGGTIDEGEPYTPPAPRNATLAAGPGMVSATSNGVDPDNRADSEDSSYNQHTALGAAPGNYYVAVYVQKLSGSTVDSLPITLLAQANDHERYDGDDWVKATYASAIPEFPAPTGAEPTKYVAPEVSDSEAASGSRSAVDWILIAGLLVAALVFAALGAVMLRRRPALA